MTVQRNLFPVGPALGNLTSNQQRVLDLLQTNPNGLRALNIGVQLHLEDGCGYCSPLRACKYAHTNATAVCQQLRRKDPPLAIKRKTGLWQALVRAPEEPGVIPF